MSIEKKIEAKQLEMLEPTTFSGAKPITRHEMELDQSISHSQSSSNFSRCLLAGKPLCSVVDPEHPINHLDTILHEILPSPCRIGKRQRRKNKKRARNNVEGELTDGENIRTAPSYSDTREARSECTDHQTCDLPNPEADKQSIRNVQADIDYDGIEPIPVEIIERYRLTMSQIRDLPRFKDYDPGTPSQVRECFFLFLLLFHNMSESVIAKSLFWFVSTQKVSKSG